MTFAELEDNRGISKASAIKLVRRHGWRRQWDNKGNVLVLVPLPWAQATEAGEPDSTGDNLADNTLDRLQAISALEPVISCYASGKSNERAALREQIDVVKEEAERERSEPIGPRRAGMANASAPIRCETCWTLPREELAATRETEKRPRTQAHAAQDEASKLRQPDAQRRARGLIARLRAA
jgi:hypothetical protein